MVSKESTIIIIDTYIRFYIKYIECLKENDMSHLIKFVTKKLTAYLAKTMHISSLIRLCSLHEDTFSYQISAQDFGVGRCRG